MKDLFQPALLLFFLLLVPKLIFGQEVIDSLETALLTTEEDSIRINIYQRLIYEYGNQDPVKAVQLSEEALEIVQNLPDTILLPDL